MDIVFHRQFLELIEEYQRRVREAASLFQRFKAIDPGELMYWRQTGLPQIGFLDPEFRIKYCFHGIGCRVDLPSGTVDWDFGHDGRLDGFDAWRLWLFAVSMKGHFPRFAEKEVLDKAFREAVSLGIIHKPYCNLQDGLYYLRTTTGDMK